MDATSSPALAAPGASPLFDDTRSTDRLRLAIAAAEIGIWEWDPHTDLFSGCPRALALWDLEPGEHRWSELLRRLHPNDRGLVSDRLHAALENQLGYEAEFRVQPPDGGERWLFIRGRAQYDAAGQPCLMHGIVTDATSRQEPDGRFERLAREAQGHADDIQDVLEFAPAAIWVVHDPEGQRVTGNTCAEEIGVHPPPRADGVPSSSAAAQTHACSIWCAGRELAPRDLPVQRATRTGKIVHDEMIELRFADGHRVHLMQSAVPLLDRDGHVRGAVAVGADVTALCQAEEALKSEAHRLEQLVQQRTRRMQESVAEMEAFSYNVSHDMRAPLRAIHSFARFLNQEYGATLPIQGRDYLARILAASARMDRLIQDVLVYSRAARTELKPERVNLVRLLHTLFDAYPDLRNTPADFSIADDLPVVLGNDAALLQCLANIVGNALKFVPSGQRPQVRIWAEREGDRARVFVRDNGIGIAPAAQSRVFDMFFRANTSFEGSGIGLAVTKKSIERMGGSIGVTSEPGHGSTFYFDLPLAS